MGCAARAAMLSVYRSHDATPFHVMSPPSRHLRELRLTDCTQIENRPQELLDLVANAPNLQKLELYRAVNDTSVAQVRRIEVHVARHVHVCVWSCCGVGVHLIAVCTDAMFSVSHPHHRLSVVSVPTSTWVCSGTNIVLPQDKHWITPADRDVDMKMSWVSRHGDVGDV